MFHLLRDFAHGTGALGPHRECFSSYEHFQFEIITALALHVCHWVNLAQSLHELATDLVYIITTFHRPRNSLQLLECLVLLDGLNDETACVFLYDHKLEDVAALVDRPL